ncbi:MAG: hypothetical protein V1909_02600 [Candidatus Micrarchaeota archaeon]
MISMLNRSDVKLLNVCIPAKQMDALQELKRTRGQTVRWQVITALERYLQEVGA